MSAIDLSDFLYKRAAMLNLSATEVANKAGISRQTWYRLINADVQQARISTLMRVADALHVSLVELSCLYNKKNSVSQTGSMNTVKNTKDAYVFIRDVSYPLNAMVGQNEVFKKTWEYINVGNTPWVNRRLVCVDSEFDVYVKPQQSYSTIIKENNHLIPLENSIEIPTTAPSEHLLLSVWFRAPKRTGTMASLWKTIDAQGNYCYPQHRGSSCQVRVVKRSMSTVKAIT